VKGQRSPLLVIFLVVFIDLLGFGLILPLLPFYAESLGAGEVQIGILLVAFAAMQFIGAPILGSLSDRFGRRPLLIVSQLGTVIAFLILGAADSWALLLLSRLVGGLMGGNITVAQAYIADVTDEANRAQGLALIGAAFGLGFILGPVAGGFLAGASLTPVDAYALTLFRWGGMAGIDPATLPAYTAFAERVAAQAPVAAALQREGLQVHTYKPA